MDIISFAYTSPALLAGVKTVTRRDWNAGYAKRFKKDKLVQAYNRSQRHGGKRIAIIGLTQDAYLEPWSEIPETDFEAEGFEYLALHTRYHGFWMNKNDTPEKRLTDIRAYFIDCLKIDRSEWVVRFEVMEFIKEKAIGAQLELF